MEPTPQEVDRAFEALVFGNKDLSGTDRLLHKFKKSNQPLAAAFWLRRIESKEISIGRVTEDLIPSIIGDSKKSSSHKLLTRVAELLLNRVRASHDLGSEEIYGISHASKLIMSVQPRAEVANQIATLIWNRYSLPEGDLVRVLNNRELLEIVKEDRNQLAVREAAFQYLRFGGDIQNVLRVVASKFQHDLSSEEIGELRKHSRSLLELITSHETELTKTFAIDLISRYHLVSDASLYVSTVAALLKESDENRDYPPGLTLETHALLSLCNYCVDWSLRFPIEDKKDIAIACVRVLAECALSKGDRRAIRDLCLEQGSESIEAIGVLLQLRPWRASFASFQIGKHISEDMMGKLSNHLAREFNFAKKLVNYPNFIRGWNSRRSKSGKDDARKESRKET